MKVLEIRREWGKNDGMRKINIAEDPQKKMNEKLSKKMNFDVDRIRTCESRAHEEVLEACTSRLNHSATTSDSYVVSYFLLLE